PTREQLAKLDRKRAKKGSNDDWVHPHDPEAEITQLKDGRTHLAYKAEHAVDLETGAVVAVTVAGGAAGDTETILETLPQAGEHIAEVACATNQEEVGERVHPEGPIEAVTDKGYHSNDTLTALANVLKRVLIHLGGFNLSLIMRRRFGKGTPRGWQGFSADALLMGLQFWIAILVRVAQESTSPQMLRSSPVVRVT